MDDAQLDGLIDWMLSISLPRGLNFQPRETLYKQYKEYCRENFISSVATLRGFFISIRHINPSLVGSIRRRRCTKLGERKAMRRVTLYRINVSILKRMLDPPVIEKPPVEEVDPTLTEADMVIKIEFPEGVGDPNVETAPIEEAIPTDIDDDLL